MKTVLIKTQISLILCLFHAMSISQQLAIDFHGIQAMGIGKSYTNIQGVQACFSNPAGLYHITGYQFSLSAENQFEVPELTAFQLAAAVAMEKYGTLGIGFIQFGTDGYINYKTGISYAKILLDKLIIGVKLDWLHTRIRDYGNVDHFPFEVGMIGKLNDKIKIGIHVFSPYGFDFTANRKIPTIMAIGVHYRVSSQVELTAEFEKNTYYALRIKTGISYKITEYMTLNLGLFTESGAANMSSGIQLALKNKYMLHLGVIFNQHLGLSSGIGFDFKI